MTNFIEIKKKRTDLVQRCFPVFLPLGFHKTLLYLRKRACLFPLNLTKMLKSTEKRLNWIKTGVVKDHHFTYLYKRVEENLNFQNPFQGNYLLRTVISLFNFIVQVAPKYFFFNYPFFCSTLLSTWLQFYCHNRWLTSIKLRLAS